MTKIHFQDQNDSYQGTLSIILLISLIILIKKMYVNKVVIAVNLFDQPFIPLNAIIHKEKIHSFQYFNIYHLFLIKGVSHLN